MYDDNGGANNLLCCFFVSELWLVVVLDRCEELNIGRLLLLLLLLLSLDQRW